MLKWVAKWLNHFELWVQICKKKHVDTSDWASVERMGAPNMFDTAGQTNKSSPIKHENKSNVLSCLMAFQILSNTTKHDQTAIAIFLVYKHWRHIPFDIQICQPRNKRSHCFNSQLGSGWHINNNRWRHEKHRCITMFDVVWSPNIPCLASPLPSLTLCSASGREINLGFIWQIGSLIN